jgi:hypothetical protein
MIIDPTIYTAVALKVALKGYAKHGLRMNRGWTPKAMMAKASEITGQQFKPRDYLGAAEALHVWLEANRQTEVHT